MTRREILTLPAAMAAGAGEFATVLAPASAANRRNSEADIAVLRDGRLLAAWSDFYGGAEDHAAARISGAHSSDGGRTWSTRFTLQENTGKQNVMSASFLRSRAGELLLFYLVKNSATDLYPEVRRSSDEGKTWSGPARVVKDAGYYGMNNARVVRLQSGRILCPTYFGDAGFRNFRTVMHYSDDDGRTWRRGRSEIACPKRGAMEPGVLEMKDGRVLQIIRTQVGRIWHAYSKDGGDTWSEAQPWTVTAPEAPSTLVRMPGSGWLLVYNPVFEAGARHGGRRTPLVASISRDEGRTWSKPKVLEDDAAATYAYTSVTFHRKSTLLTYYEERGGLLSLKFRSIPDIV